ncbi:ABC transporter substrate-binding protein [Caulobacter sp. S45]|uniref:ABC transporter substrate-binding protein n=1 Tax=Caulobacter sp. S45 TaxID=1641861 RepID=UPI00131D8DB1|nr:ABC transporter substrate-binding protein [Caulobacter sp. S45]
MNPARALAAIVVVLALAAPAQAATPRRIVSLNPCLDAILLDVADPGQIVALSHYSRDPAQSAVAVRAKRFPFTWGSAEEVAALKPDLVLMSGMGASSLRGVLPRLHIPSAEFTVPYSVDESLAQVRRVAMLSGHPERGEALVARIEAALAAAGPAPGTPRLSALLFEGHGLASGPHTLMDELMRRTGFDNATRRFGMTHSIDLPLERLIADPPQVLLSGRMEAGEPTWADRVLSHPALAAVRSRMKREALPETLVYCAGPVMIPTVQALAAARRDALRTKP